MAGEVPAKPGEAAPRAPEIHQELAQRIAASAEAARLAGSSEQARLIAEVQTNAIVVSVTEFCASVKEKKLSFAGDAELEKNDAYKAARDGLRAFFAASKSAEAPEKNLQEVWRKAAVNFLLAELGTYDGILSKIELAEVNASLAILKDKSATGKSGLQGIGICDEWLSLHPTPEYRAWQEQQAQKKAADESQAQSQAAAKKQGEELQAKRVAPLTAKKNELAAILPQAIADATTKLETDLKAATDEAGVKAVETAIPQVEAQIAPFEKLHPYLAQTPEIPDAAKKLIFDAVKAGTKTPDQAVADLERAKQAATTQNAMEYVSADDAPMIDKGFAFVEKMKPGKWKTILGGLLVAAATLFAGFAKLPWIGEKIRGSVMSNRMLAKRFHDKQSEVCYKAELEFEKFGLPSPMLNQIFGEMRTKDVIAAVNDKDKLKQITEDPATQKRLADFSAQLERKNGVLDERPLFEFMGANPEWAGVDYAGTAPAPAPAPPAAPPAPMPTVATAAPASAPPAKPAG